MAGTLNIHTDVSSAKVAALLHNPRAALHVWDASPHLQSRIDVTVEILTGSEVAAIWARVPGLSRQSYGTVPAPGQPIVGALAYQACPDPAAFAVLRCTVRAIDVLHLGPQHRRGRFDLVNRWAGQWLAP